MAPARLEAASRCSSFVQRWPNSLLPRALIRLRRHCERDPGRPMRRVARSVGNPNRCQMARIVPAQARAAPAVVEAVEPAVEAAHVGAALGRASVRHCGSTRTHRTPPMARVARPHCMLPRPPLRRSAKWLPVLRSEPLVRFWQARCPLGPRQRRGARQWCGSRACSVVLRARTRAHHHRS